MTLSNADKLRFIEVKDRIAREFGDHDTMDFLTYLERLKEEHADVEALQKQVKELKETNEYLDSTLDEIRSML